MISEDVGTDWDEIRGRGWHMSPNLLKKRGVERVKRTTQRAFRHTRVAVVHIAGVLKADLRAMILKRNLKERRKIIA